MFLRGYTLRQLASRRSAAALPAFRYRFRQALRRFVARPNALKIPDGPLVLLADGLWFEFQQRHWILYLTALKSCDGKRALFLDPLLLPGKEGASKWRKAIDAIPGHVRRRISAIVVDNLLGMRQLARNNQWVLQLCQFHLVLKFQVPRRAIRRAVRGGRVRRKIYVLVRNAMDLPEGPELQSTLERLHHVSESDYVPPRIRTIIREFLAQNKFYRSYRTHPDLGLPTTNNAVESMGRIVREMLRRNRAGSNPESLLRWTTALIRMRPEITCNGHHINR